MIWEEILECRDYDDTPCQWACKIGNEYVWIDKYNDKAYNIDKEIDGCIVTIKTCKTLTSAKRWVTINLA